MKIQTASTRTEGLAMLYDYHTGFFPRALDGISKEDMHNRLGTAANHMAWLAGALIAQRFVMTTETGTSFKQTGEELFKNNKGIQEDITYPSNDEYTGDWYNISADARKALVSMDDAKLDSPFEMGEMKMSYYELISFTIYREASMIGQLALWRRLLGYPAMRYD